MLSACLVLCWLVNLMLLRSKQTLKKYLVAYPFLGKVLSLSLTTLIAHVITLLYYPLLTKSYSAEDFGNFQTFQSVCAYFITICSLRYDQAIITSSDREERLRLFSSSLVIAILFSIVLAAILFLSRGVIHGFVNYRIISEYWYLVPLSTMIGGWINACLNIVIIEQKFRTIGFSKILQSSVTVFGQVVSNTLFRSIGLIVGDMAGRLASIFVFIKYTFRVLYKEASLFTWSSCLKACKKYQEFVWLSTPGALLNLAGLNLPMLIIAGYYNQATYGYIALVDRLFGLPSALIGQSVAQVFTAEFSLAVSESPEKARILFLRQVKYLSLLIAPVILFLPFAPSFFSFVFGENWITSGYFFILLAPLNIAGFIIIPVIPALTILNKQKVLFFWVSGRVVITVSSVLALSIAGVDVKIVLGVHAVIMAVLYAVYGLIAYRSIIQLKPREVS